MRSPSFFVLLAVVLVVACGGGGSDEPAAVSIDVASATPVPARATLPPFPTREAQPTSTPVTTYAAGTHTDIAVIDATLEVIAVGDSAELLEQLSFHPYRCDTAPPGTEGSNPCPPGVPDGSPVDVIAFGGCEVRFLAQDRANLPSELAGFAEAVRAEGVYAVTEVAVGRLASPLPLRYLVILSGGYTLLLDDAGITHIGLPCAGVGPADLYHPADTTILAPL